MPGGGGYVLVRHLFPKTDWFVGGGRKEILGAWHSHAAREVDKIGSGQRC
jgi:hypothetical protein